MKNLLIKRSAAAWLPILLTLLGATVLRAADARLELGGRVWVSRLTAHTWVVLSEHEFEGFGTVQSNALVVEGDQGSILIDTPATVTQTERVLNWAQSTLGKPVQRVIVTHAHRDRLGGISATDRLRIPSDSLARTIELAKERGYAPPGHALKPDDIVTIPGATVRTYFPGHGHTEDNIVVWIPVDKVLHGGCFVKGADATDLGNMEEIDPAQWRKGVADVMRRYSGASVVVPGHGDPGNLDLLRHTTSLLDKHGTGR